MITDFRGKSRGNGFWLLDFGGQQSARVGNQSSRLRGKRNAVGKKLVFFNKLLYTIGMKDSDATQPASNRKGLPHHRFDIVAKDAIYTFPEDVLQFLMQESDIEFLEHLESEFTTVETRQMDSLIKVLLNGEPALVHCEFQTSDSTHLEMVRRNVGYLGRCYERYGLPILFACHLPASRCR